MIHPDAAAARTWDAVVVGTGMGGATIGHALARAGWRVLFLEKGRADIRAAHQDGASAVRLAGDYPELIAGDPRPGSESWIDALQRGGRATEAITDRSRARPRRFVPFMGCGAGGSSALYGMALERFFPADFTPAAHLRAPGSTAPPRWPVTYDDLAPWYAAAEALYGVRGGADPLRIRAQEDALPPGPRLSPQGAALSGMLAQHGLHPYRLPLACEWVEGCQGCQGYLCARACKHDAASTCLHPALERHGAELLDRCEVVRLDADAAQVTALVCRRDDRELRVRGRIVILAAGALATPALLLRSASSTWPDGLVNRSGMVGRNLMRHFVDLYAVAPKAGEPASTHAKEIGSSDFYLTADAKLGALQSFGPMPPAELIADGLEASLAAVLGPTAARPFRALARPLIVRTLRRLFARAEILATILEDPPYADNAVTLADPAASHAGIAIRYRIHAADAVRIRDLRVRVRAALAGRRVRLVRQAESNERLAHVCGTCRFGDDPGTSVLDGNNKAHDIDNLYVVDASFFPSSGGTNPALTIAANALRVAAHLTAQGRRDVS